MGFGGVSAVGSDRGVEGGGARHVDVKVGFLFEAAADDVGSCSREGKGDAERR